QGDPPSMAVHDRVLGPTQCGTTEDDHEVHERRMQTKHEPVYAGSSLSWLMHGKAPPEMPAFQPYRGKPAVRNDREGRGNDGIIRSPGSRLDSTRRRDEDGPPPHLLGRRNFLHLAVGAAALPAVSRFAWAQAYPTRPVRIIVGFGSGSAFDILARLIGQSLSDRLGQPFIIENRGGAGGNLATEAVVRAPADGYTLLLCGSPDTITPTLCETVQFNFIHDIAPVASVARGPNVLVVHPSFPAKTIPEFITHAKANPAKISFASAGIGSVSHMAAELFKAMAGVDMVHVPYRSVAPALTDLIGGQVQAIFSTTPPSIERIQAGKLRALAVTSTTRSDVLPDLP